MSCPKPNITFIIFKAHSEENEVLDPYVNVLKNHGYDALLVPTLDFEYHNFNELKSKLQKPHDYSGMVITSPRCARGIIKCLADDNLNENWHEKPIFVVGEATSRLVIKELNLEPIGAESGNAMNLIPIILKYDLKKPLLAPCGNLNINILADNIKTVEFENVEIYRTIPHNNLNENLNIALNQIKNQIGVLFFSPSGFRAVSNLMSKQLLNQLLIFAIGPTTGTAIQEAGHTLSGICDKPKPESVIDMINKCTKYDFLSK